MPVPPEHMLVLNNFFNSSTTMSLDYSMITVTNIGVSISILIGLLTHIRVEARFFVLESVALLVMVLRCECVKRGSKLSERLCC